MATVATRTHKNGRDGHDVHARVTALRADIDALQKDMRGLVSDVGVAAARQVHGAMDGALESAHETADRIGEWSNGNLAGVRRAARAQPLAACALSIGVGAVIGALLFSFRGNASRAARE